MCISRHPSIDSRYEDSYVPFPTWWSLLLLMLILKGISYAIPITLIGVSFINFRCRHMNDFENYITYGTTCADHTCMLWRRFWRLIQSIFDTSAPSTNRALKYLSAYTAMGRMTFPKYSLAELLPPWSLAPLTLPGSPSSGILDIRLD